MGMDEFESNNGDLTIPDIETLRKMKTPEKVQILAEYVLNIQKFAVVEYSDGDVELWFFNSLTLKPNAKHRINQILTKRFPTVVTTHIVNEVERYILAMCDFVIPRSNLDPLHLLPFKNYVFDLYTLEVLDYEDCLEMGYVFTKRLPFELDIPFLIAMEEDRVDWKQYCPTFIQFLERFYDEEDRKKLLYVLAQSFEPEIMKKKTAFVIGDPNTGKTTLKEVLLHVFGDMATTSSIYILHKTHFSLANLIGKRLVLLSEKPGYINAEFFKQLTGGETLPIDMKYRPLISAPISATFVFFMNEPPLFTQLDEAVADRVFIIYTRNPLKAGEKDPTIFVKLKSETPYILMYILYHYIKYKKGEFVVEQDIDEVYRVLMKAGSNVYDFIEERCILDKTALIEAKKLYEEYVKWCAEKKEETLGRNTFYAHVEQYLLSNKAGCRITKGKGNVMFKGITVEANVSDSSDWSLDEVLGGD